jgi:hypothetical protein
MFFSGYESPFSENVQVLVDIIRDFGVGHVDYLACNSLQYDNWKQYYELLKTTANVVIGASNDATGNIQYGGDWVMENTNQDIKTIYFGDSIDEYTKTLATEKIISGAFSSNNNIYIKQLTNGNIYWSTTNNSANDTTTGTWEQINTAVDWQVKLENTNTTPNETNRLVVTFLTNITISHANNYFIIGSHYVSVDGGNKTVTVSGVTDYPGLIQNGVPNVANGFSNITVTNINTQITGTTTLAFRAGYICQSYFCTGSSGINTISNCTNIGPVSANDAGGIAGYAFAQASSGTNTISNCTNSGPVSGGSAGGIAGGAFASSAQEDRTNTISNCTNSGPISGNYAGGIAGNSFAYNAASVGTNTITNCTNSGTISGYGAGGIAGPNFAYNSKSGRTNTITNCTNSGTISGSNAGGIAGNNFASGAQNGSTNTISNCTNSGPISGYGAGGIAGPNFALNSAGTNKIKNCYTTNGNIGVSPSYTEKTHRGPWSTATSLTILSFVQVQNNAYIWAYQKVNGVDKLNSPFLLYSLNPTNTPVDPTILLPTNIINFTVPSPKTFGVDTSFVLQNPSSSSPADFSYNSTNKSVATISNRTVTIVGAGTTTITVAQDACGNYVDGVANRQLVVNPLPPNPPAITNILPNQITGTYVANSTIVVTETTINNQTTTSEIQSDAQGIWNFNVSNPANNYSFAPLNATQFVSTLTSSYSFRYPQSTYSFTLNTPVLTKPRQYGTNQQDQRSWRISPKLPAGLKFSHTTGIISGTPTEPAPSTTYTVWSTSEVFLSYRKQVTIEII